MLTNSDIVLFQGDSITDAGRNRKMADNENARFHAPVLGHGYAALLSARLLCDMPGIACYNRGISGNRVTDLMDRWDPDAIALKPTLVSILIGVNDTWHGIAKGTPENGTTIEVYEKTYRALLDKTKADLPGVKLVICEPFTTQTGPVLELNFHPDIDHRREICKQLASDHQATWVPYHSMFEELCKKAPADYWAFDGVHPTAPGFMAMTDLWLKCVNG